MNSNDSKKMNMSSLANVLHASNADLDGANQMRRDINSQDSSFRGSLDGQDELPKQSLITEQLEKRAHTSNNSISIPGHQFSTTVPGLYMKGEKEIPFKKPSTKSNKPSNQWWKDKKEVNPNLQSINSEISKKVHEIKRQENNEVVVLTPNDANKRIMFDETLPQRSACAHCLMKKRTIVSAKGKDANIDHMYCDKHTVGKSGPHKSKSPNTRNQNLPKSTPDLTQAQPVQQASQNTQETEEIKTLLEFTEKDLYEKTEELKNMGFENEALRQEITNLRNDKDALAIQLHKANLAYNESIKIIETLLERIRKHLLTDISLYNKIQTTDGINKLNSWNEVPKMKAECEELLRQIREKPWETVKVEESKEFIAKLDEANKLRNELLKLRIEGAKDRAVIEKLEKYIQNLEAQCDNITKDPALANKNNIMKILQLNKDIKELGVREAGLLRDLELARVELDELKDGSPESQKEASQQKIDLLKKELAHKDDMITQLNDELEIQRIEGSRPKAVSAEDVQDAINQLSMIILSKEGNEISDKTRKLLKDVFPDAFAKNIHQWEKRVQELEEQNKRLLAAYNQEVQKGKFYAMTGLEVCRKLLEFLHIMDENKNAQLPVPLQKYREGLYAERNGLEQIYRELKGALNDYESKTQNEKNEANELDVNRLGQRSSHYPSRAPMYGTADYNQKPLDQGNHNDTTLDENTAASQIKRLKEENHDIRQKLENTQTENASLAIQLTHYKQREENMNKTISRYESIARGISPLKEKSDQRSGAKMFKMGGRSGESSFSILHELGTAEPIWFKNKIMENSDYLMMLHVQGLAIEDSVKKSQKIQDFGDQLGLATAQTRFSFVDTGKF